MKTESFTYTRRLHSFIIILTSHNGPSCFRISRRPSCQIKLLVIEDSGRAIDFFGIEIKFFVTFTLHQILQMTRIWICKRQLIGIGLIIYIPTKLLANELNYSENADIEFHSIDLPVLCSVVQYTRRQALTRRQVSNLY